MRFEYNNKIIIKPLPPLCCGHIVYSREFPEITLGVEGLNVNFSFFCTLLYQTSLNNDEKDEQDEFKILPFKRLYPSFVMISSPAFSKINKIKENALISWCHIVWAIMACSETAWIQSSWANLLHKWILPAFVGSYYPLTLIRICGDRAQTVIIGG